jgi:signal transduction histidine kinase
MEAMFAMPAAWTSTLTKRTLLPLGLVVSGMILMLAGFTYFGVFRSIEAQNAHLPMALQKPIPELRAEAFATTRWVMWTAFGTLAVTLALLAWILRHTIAMPVVAMASAARGLAADGERRALDVDRADELGKLALALNEMAAEVSARDAALRDEKASLQRRVAARTVELEAALAQQTELGRLKTDFVSMVSHEFRTPLGVIMSASEILQRYFDRLSGDQRGQHLQMIVDSTQNLAKLMEGVLMLGRVEQGRLRFEPAMLDLDRFCQSMVTEVQAATQGGQGIRYQPFNDLSGATGDEGLLRHILSNLLSNAVKYGDAGGPVDFIVRRDGDSAQITIRDQGIGIPLEDQARLFTSFTRARNVGSRQGTGLGLVVVHRCIVCHGGTLDLKSAEGEGTTVIVRLPLWPILTSDSEFEVTPPIS